MDASLQGIPCSHWQPFIGDVSAIQIPLYPVLVTGQTLVVLLIGMAYGPRLGGVTVATYLLQGVIGLPVCWRAFGVATLLGPTGGYLGGFLIAAVVVGVLAERGMGRGIMSTIVAMMIGNAIIYVVGQAGSRALLVSKRH